MTDMTDKTDMSNGQTPSDKPARNITDAEQDSKNMKKRI